MLVWLILMIVFGVLEAVTVGLTSIWFSLGALAALGISTVTTSIWIQTGVFLGVSLLTLMLVRPVAQKYFNVRRVATNADRIIGQNAVVTQEIDNLKGQGQVSIAGQIWTARSSTDGVISPSTTVRVMRIEGVKVFVSPVGGQVPQ